MSDIKDLLDKWIRLESDRCRKQFCCYYLRFNEQENAATDKNIIEAVWEAALDKADRVRALRPIGRNPNGQYVMEIDSIYGSFRSIHYSEAAAYLSTYIWFLEVAKDAEAPKSFTIGKSQAQAQPESLSQELALIKVRQFAKDCGNALLSPAEQESIATEFERHYLQLIRPNQVLVDAANEAQMLRAECAALKAVCTGLQNEVRRLKEEQRNYA
jgi:hypothetical protein